ncbi:MAG TPA: ATP-binding protein, partial [Nitrolancea sp.]|nr:ATP-binding protein [Nitrolancea sp.]
GSGHPADAGGSGLGLSIVRWVATTHGGDLRIDSAVDHGTTVEVWLPLAGTPNTDSTARETPALVHVR